MSVGIGVSVEVGVFVGTGVLLGVEVGADVFVGAATTIETIKVEPKALPAWVPKRQLPV